MEKRTWPTSKPVTRSMTRGGAQEGCRNDTEGVDDRVASFLPSTSYGGQPSCGIQGPSEPSHQAQASQDGPAPEVCASAELLRQAGPLQLVDVRHGQRALSTSLVEPSVETIPRSRDESSPLAQPNQPPCNANPAPAREPLSRPCSDLGQNHLSQRQGGPGRVAAPAAHYQGVTNLGQMPMGGLQDSFQVPGCRSLTSCPAMMEGQMNGSGFPVSVPPPQLTYRGAGESWSNATQPGSTAFREPKMSFPTYSGKGDWQVFWVQFERLVARFAWTDDVALDRLVSCLRDEALEHYAEEAREVQSNFGLLRISLDRRFGDRTLPETYRASLQTLKRNTKESLEEYAARVRRVVNKAYPGITGRPLLEEITIEHLINGLTDQSLIYDVMTKKPRTVEMALDLIQWHESCRNLQRRKSGVRSLKAEPEAGQGPSASAYRVNGKNYVTEERLHQFGGELKNGIVKEIKDLVKKPHQNKRDSRWKESIECFACHGMGHFARECPAQTNSNAQREQEDEEQLLN